MAEGYPSLLAYKNESLAFPAIPIYVATKIVGHNRSVKMSAIQVTMPLQMMCRLMVASQLGENVTLPLNWNPTLVRNETLPVNREPKLAGITDSPVLPAGYASFPEIGFAYKYTANRINRDEARKKCLEDNGQLAVIDSREKMRKIIIHFIYDSAPWVGLQRSYDTQLWTTIDGKSADNLPWAGGYPESVNSRRCVRLNVLFDGLINQDCDDTWPYLCEIALPRN